VLERDSPDRLLLFRVLTRNLSVEVFSHLDSEAQNALLGELNTDEIRRLITNLEPDDRTHLFEELPDRVVQRLLNLLSPADLKASRLLLSYPDESVGRLNTSQFGPTGPSTRLCNTFAAAAAIAKWSRLSTSPTRIGSLSTRSIFRD